MARERSRRRAAAMPQRAETTLINVVYRAGLQIKIARDTVRKSCPFAKILRCFGLDRICVMQ
jgi:hypothetical protein